MKTYIEMLALELDGDNLAVLDAAKIMAGLMLTGSVVVRLADGRPIVDNSVDYDGYCHTEWHDFQQFTLQQLVSYLSRLEPNQVAQIELDFNGDYVEVTLDTYEII